MNILFVVQRYGLQISGGAELHCRLIAEHLAKKHSVEIATTCANDYLTWENVYTPGTEVINGIKVHRFPVEQERPPDFDSLAYEVLYGHPTITRQKEYLDAHGPVCPKLIEYLKKCIHIDRFVLFSYRYWITWQAVNYIGEKAVLVPTAEHDRSLYLDIYRDSFHKPMAIAYNSTEERRNINHITNNFAVPGITVGVGLPENNTPLETLNDNVTLDIPQNFFLYIGRIEESKGCCNLISDYLAYHDTDDNPPALVLMGKKHIPVPHHPGIFYLGIQPDDVKMVLLSKTEALLMPSKYESLSMVLLEAWMCAKPAVCNAHCDVLLGQCQRSGGGLYYRNTEEFIEILGVLHKNAELRSKLGQQGLDYYKTHYRWSVIMEKYDQLLDGCGDNS
jgi:glycosyltransferase involved in cell wall biosynthesis